MVCCGWVGVVWVGGWVGGVVGHEQEEEYPLYVGGLKEPGV